MAPAPQSPLNLILDVLVMLALVLAMLWGLSLVVAHGFAAMGILGLVAALVACAFLLSYGRSWRTRRTPQAR